MRFTMTSKAPLALALSLAMGAAQATTVAYTLDPNHTQVQFNWTHLQYSNPGASFDDVSGTLMWDGEDITRSSVSVSIGAGSIHSHVAVLDDKLKSPEFLDAQKFPKLTFVSSRVERGDGADRYKVSGDLTVHGVTRPVVLDVHLNRVGVYPFLNVPAAGFDATTTIRRSEFGVGEGVPMVSDELRVQITAEAMEAVSFAKAMKAIAESAAQQPKK